MSQFAAPQFAWFLAVPAGIVVLYLLRRKYLPRLVPSTFLWRTAVRDHAANKPLQRLRSRWHLPGTRLSLSCQIRRHPPGERVCPGSIPMHE